MCVTTLLLQWTNIAVGKYSTHKLFLKQSAVADVLPSRVYFLCASIIIVSGYQNVQTKRGVKWDVIARAAPFCFISYRHFVHLLTLGFIGTDPAPADVMKGDLLPLGASGLTADLLKLSAWAQFVVRKVEAPCFHEYLKHKLSRMSVTYSVFLQIWWLCWYFSR